MTARWTFHDDVADETWVMPINPNRASSPFQTKAFTTAQGADIASTGIARTRVFQAPLAPKEWEFGGILRTQAHHDALVAWVKKDNEVTITDHLERSFEVLLRAVQFQEQRPRPGALWRMTYTVNALVLRPAP